MQFGDTADLKSALRCAAPGPHLPFLATENRPENEPMSPSPLARPPSFMLIAGEASGDALAAELVCALRATPAIRALPFAPRFFEIGRAHV